MKILNTRRIEIIRFHSSDDSKIVSFALNWTVEFSFWREICRNFWKISIRVKLNYQKLETFFSLFRTKKGKRSRRPIHSTHVSKFFRRTKGTGITFPFTNDPKNGLVANSTRFERKRPPPSPHWKARTSRKFERAVVIVTRSVVFRSGKCDSRPVGGAKRTTNWKKEEAH